MITKRKLWSELMRISSRNLNMGVKAVELVSRRLQLIYSWVRARLLKPPQNSVLTLKVALRKVRKGRKARIFPYYLKRARLFQQSKSHRVVYKWIVLKNGQTSINTHNLSPRKTSWTNSVSNQWPQATNRIHCVNLRITKKFNSKKSTLAQILLFNVIE